MTHEEIKSKIKSFWTDEKLGQEFEEKCEDYCTYGEDYGEDLEYESAYEYYTNHCMGGAVEYDLMEDMERWARENGIDCDEETLSDVTREIITEQPWCDSFVFRGGSSNSDYDKLKSSFDNLFDNKNNKYNMKHLKTFNEDIDTTPSNFDMMKSELLSKLDELYNLYDNYTYEVSPKHWRSTGTHFTELRKMKEDIQRYTEITEEEKNNPHIKDQLKKDNI